MFHYDLNPLKDSIKEIIIQNITPEAWNWIETKIASQQTNIDFNATFAAVPRRTGKNLLFISNAQKEQLSTFRPGFQIENWSADRLTRVWLLLHLDAADQEKYYSSIENLFLAAEMNELVALYSSLPLLAYPEMWIKRCAEGNRSNIGDVLAAIMYNNPYPSENLPQPAWNQLVLKAFFTDKQIDRITGLQERANKELANTLTDYARERQSAGRTIDPALWLLADQSSL